MSNRKRLRLLVRHFHENGLKFVLENPGNVHDLLQLLGVQLLPRIDFSRMRVVPGRFVGRDYRHLESDLVLRPRCERVPAANNGRCLSISSSSTSPSPTASCRCGCWNTW